MNGKRGGRRGPFTVYRLPFTLLVLGCGVTPLTNKIDVGNEAFVVGVGEGPDSMTDLFAAPAGGGNFARLTFNRAEERAPRLASDGRSVAFQRRAGAAAEWTLVVLDLLTNQERVEPAPGNSTPPERLGPHGEGVVAPCGAEQCVTVGDSATSLGQVTGVMRWGSDSVGYFVGQNFEVRPLGGGRSRRPLWKQLPANLRELTYHSGKLSP